MSKNKLPRKMSHFSTIKTQLKEKKHLVEALQLVGERPNVPSDLGMSVVDLVFTDTVKNR